VLVLAVCGGGVGLVWYLLQPHAFPEQTQDYADARKSFRTSLLRRGPSPQDAGEDREEPPPGVREVPFRSGGLMLRAWVNEAPAGAARPGVLFLHGGFAFGEDDWDQCQPFRDAGFVTLVPTLRGENGLPGDYTMFYDEVDDVLAAAEVLARTSGVDPNRIFVAGHSVGGTLTLLAALTSRRFKAAASFSGSPDQVAWARFQEELVPFNPEDPREFEMRSPLAFYRSFKCPTRLFYGTGEPLFSSASEKLAAKASAVGLDVKAVAVPGDHMSSVLPAMRQAVAFFRHVR
jgi:dipeptidyl aminopeptidase/acylaminoacyl peptidase